MWITLTPDEIQAAKDAGIARQLESRQRGLTSHVFDPSATQTEIDMIGSIAEYAGAKLFNKQLTATNTFQGADLGGDIEIRAIRKVHGKWRNLILRPADKTGLHDTGKFVVGVMVADLDDAGPYQVAGWYTLDRVKPEWREGVGTRQEYYLVLRQFLFPIEDLIKLKEEEL